MLSDLDKARIAHNQKIFFTISAQPNPTFLTIEQIDIFLFLWQYEIESEIKRIDKYCWYFFQNLFFLYFKAFLEYQENGLASF